MVNKESIVYVVLFFVGVVLSIESLRLGLGSGRHPGSGFLPFFIGVALSITTFYSLCKNFLGAEKRRGRDIEQPSERFGVNVGKIVAALSVYVLIVSWLGYALSTIILFIVLFRVGGFQRWASILFLSFLATSISYLVFSYWLHVRFPKGFLGF